MSTLIESYRGDTVPISITVKNKSTGTARNLTGETVTLKVSQYLGGPQVWAAKSFTITDAANGLATLELSASDTANMIGEYQFIVEVTTAASKPYTALSGVMKFTNKPQ